MKIFAYQVKCRRCGNISEFAIGNDPDKSEEENKKYVITYLYDRSNEPVIFDCEHCQKKSVGDIVGANF